MINWSTCKYAIACLLLQLFSVAQLTAQQQVANYSIGEFGSPAFEQFSFWTTNGHADSVLYTYGAEPKEMRLQFSSTTDSILVVFSNQYALTIIPGDLSLQITDTSKKYNKIFLWQYEGPVNGIGTYCTVCAQSDKEAMELVRLFLIRQ